MTTAGDQLVLHTWLVVDCPDKEQVVLGEVHAIDFWIPFRVLVVVANGLLCWIVELPSLGARSLDIHFLNHRYHGGR